MTTAATYSVFERLRDGSTIQIRSLHPDDREGMLAAIERTSAQSLRRRFFVAKRAFSDKEIAFFTDVDFGNHVALIAEFEENGRSTIVGGGRYIVCAPDEADLAFVVIDSYQGKGIGAALLRHLISLARNAGLKVLTADVVHENVPMLSVFKRFGFKPHSSRDPAAMHLKLDLFVPRQ